MNRRRLAVIWLLSSAALAALTSMAVLHWHLAHEHEAPHLSAAESEERFHAWVHGNLKPTPEQDAAMHAAEQSFAMQRRELRDRLRSATEALRSAVLRDRGDSPAVQQAGQAVASAQAALQQATLTHFFAMADQLDPVRRGQLIHWLHDSLQPPP